MEDPIFVPWIDGGKCRYFPNCAIHDGTIRIRGSRSRLFTADEVRAIRLDDRYQSIIAAEFHVDQKSISDIKRGRTYKWVS